MHRVVVLPRTEQLPPGLAGHAVAKRSYRDPADLRRGQVEELQLGWLRAERAGDHVHRVRALHLEAVMLAPSVGAKRAPLVERHLHVVAAGLRVVGDPVQHRSAADKIELVV